MDNAFFEVTLVIGIASLLSILFRFINLPSILAYILAGIIVGPMGLLHIENLELMRSMAEIGIALLLFMLGLELRFSELKSVGKVAILAGIGQVILTAIAGFALATLFGMSYIVACYIAIAVTFSSTIIIVKLLSDKKDLTSLYGKISIGILLLQDLFAIGTLIVLSGLVNAQGSVSITDIGLMLLKAVFLFSVTLYLSQTVFPYVMNKLAKSTETLFLFSLAWAFGMSAFVASPVIGLSIEIGGFLAGLALANSYESYHISARTRSLRDFFITIFFVTLGMGMVFKSSPTLIFQGIAISLFVLIVKPIIVMAILGILGYKKRTSFFTGLVFAQVSEFSLIVIFLGSKLGHLNSDIISLVTIVSVITFGVSTYMIMNSNFLYKKLLPMLSVFERKGSLTEVRADVGELKDHTILVGVSRAGEGILETIVKEKDHRLVVVDFNPDVVTALNEKNILTVFGDISDDELMDHIKVESARVIVSTVPDIDDNLRLIKSVKKSGSRAKIILLAGNKLEAKTLYSAGCDYVVIPHVTGGSHIAKLLKEDLEAIEAYREKDLKNL